MSIGDNIKRIRELKKLSVEQLAAKMGKKPAGIYAWENGAYKPGQDSLRELAKALEVSINDLIDENPTPVENSTSNEAKVEEEEVYRRLVEGNTEYLLIPRTALEGKYRLVSLEQYEKDREQFEKDKAQLSVHNEELKRKDEQIAGLHEVIKLMVTTLKVPQVEKTK